MQLQNNEKKQKNLVYSLFFNTKIKDNLKKILGLKVGKLL